MRVLLDTHILLALLEKRTESFAPGIQRLLGDADSEFHVSVASLWEIAIKWRLGKLQLAPPLHALPDLLNAMGIELISINESHVLATVQPEPLTRDPFDRLLLAQCQIEDLRLVTIDRALVAHAMAAKTHSTKVPSL
jgi:PIN domain nuclease of toxin-antitoxin system